MRELYRGISEKSTEKLKKIAEEKESTLNAAAEAAVGIMLQKYSGSNDVVFGKVVSGRNAPINGIEEMVGLFINTIPVRVTVEKETTVGELIKKQKKRVMAPGEMEQIVLTKESFEGRSVQNITVAVED